MQQLTEFQVIGHLDRQSARELGGTNPEPRVCFEVLELPALDRIFFGFRWMKSIQENKICHCFHFSPISHEVMGPDAIILVF